jgi:hypothetical protein
MTTSNICSGCGKPVSDADRNCIRCGARNYAFIDKAEIENERIRRNLASLSARIQQEQDAKESVPETGPFIKRCKHCETLLPLETTQCTYCGNKGDWLEKVSEAKYPQVTEVRYCTQCKTRLKQADAKCPLCYKSGKWIKRTTEEGYLKVLNPREFKGRIEKTPRYSCPECGQEAIPPQTGFNNLRGSTINSVWVTSAANQKVPLCERCKRDPGVWAKYEKTADLWKSQEKVVKKVARKSHNFIFGLVVGVIILIVVVNIIAYLIHSGSCVGPDNDYSNCYP